MESATGFSSAPASESSTDLACGQALNSLILSASACLAVRFAVQILSCYDIREVSEYSSAEMTVFWIVLVEGMELHPSRCYRNLLSHHPMTIATSQCCQNGSSCEEAGEYVRVRVGHSDLLSSQACSSQIVQPSCPFGPCCFSKSSAVPRTICSLPLFCRYLKKLELNLASNNKIIQSNIKNPNNQSLVVLTVITNLPVGNQFNSSPEVDLPSSLPALFACHSRSIQLLAVAHGTLPAPGDVSQDAGHVEHVRAEQLQTRVVFETDAAFETGVPQLVGAGPLDGGHIRVVGVLVFAPFPPKARTPSAPLLAPLTAVPQVFSLPVFSTPLGVFLDFRDDNAYEEGYEAKTGQSKTQPKGKAINQLHVLLVMIFFAMSNGIIVLSIVHIWIAIAVSTFFPACFIEISPFDTYRIALTTTFLFQTGFPLALVEGKAAAFLASKGVVKVYFFVGYVVGGTATEGIHQQADQWEDSRHSPNAHCLQSNIYYYWAILQFIYRVMLIKQMTQLDTTQNSPQLHPSFHSHQEMVQLTVKHQQGTKPNSFLYYSILRHSFQKTTTNYTSIGLNMIYNQVALLTQLGQTCRLAISSIPLRRSTSRVACPHSSHAILAVSNSSLWHTGHYLLLVMQVRMQGTWNMCEQSSCKRGLSSRQMLHSRLGSHSWLVLAHSTAGTSAWLGSQSSPSSLPKHGHLLHRSSHLSPQYPKFSLYLFSLRLWAYCLIHGQMIHTKRGMKKRQGRPRPSPKARPQTTAIYFSQLYSSQSPMEAQF